MAWIESHQELRDHPKLYKLIEILSLEKPQAVGHLHLLWWWCVDYAPDGVLHVNDRQIARAACWPGDAEMFVTALIESGFLERSAGVLTVHDWLDFCGELVEKRLQRKRDKRRTTSHIRRILSGKSPPTVPYRTVPNQTEPTEPNRTVGGPNGSKRPFGPRHQSIDSEFLAECKSNDAYKGIDVDRELAKMRAWCTVNGKQESKRRFVNWLNRCERRIPETKPSEGSSMLRQLADAAVAAARKKE